MTAFLLLAALAAQTPGTEAPSAADAPPKELPLAHRPKPSAWVNLPPEQRERVLEEAAALPLQRRLLAHSARFINTPYRFSPLGEGEGIDPDPLLRYDAVDCLTFVEQSIALALARTDSEVVSTLDRVRYEDDRSYASRNHLMEAQWVPNNLRKGFLRELTRRIAGADAERVRKIITAASWTSPSSKSLGLEKEEQRLGAFELDVIPLEKVLAHARQIPSGTIALIVREERPFKVTRVTHLGFIVQKKKRTYLRHAARSVFARVVDEDLETFLTRNSKYDKWKVVGLSLLEVTEPTPSSAAAKAE